jgi:hypothetical protein
LSIFETEDKKFGIYLNISPGSSYAKQHAARQDAPAGQRLHGVGLRSVTGLSAMMLAAIRQAVRGAFMARVLLAECRHRMIDTASAFWCCSAVHLPVNCPMPEE